MEVYCRISYILSLVLLLLRVPTKTANTGKIDRDLSTNDNMQASNSIPFGCTSQSTF